jgi:hypothetical protein
MIFSTAYLAPIEYYYHFLRSEESVVDAGERYDKQSYRTRCRIASANGVVDLNIPVKKYANHSLVRDIRIAYDEEWQRNHWRTIVSSYKSSPFFDYYQDDLLPFYEKKYEFLIDFNTELQNVIFSLLDVEQSTKVVDYKDISIDPSFDFRGIKIHPKKKNITLEITPYYQVFAQKIGFQPNLSILDLICNMGPESRLLLLQ